MVPSGRLYRWPRNSRRFAILRVSSVGNEIDASVSEPVNRQIANMLGDGKEGEKRK